MSIDTGLRITYKENYPIPGIEQSTQQFRDNFAVIRYSIENIHSLEEAPDSILGVRLHVSENNGVVRLALGYVDEDVLAPVEGMLRFVNGSIEWFAFDRWIRPLTEGPGTQKIVKNIVGEMVSNTGSLGVTPEYDAEQGKINFKVADLTVNLTGDASGTATVSNLDEMNLAVRLNDTSVKDIVGDLVGEIQHNGIDIVYEQNAGKLLLNAKNFDVTLAGEVSGRATVSGLSNTTIHVVLDRETVQDIIGAMVSGNSETGIQVTYDDPNGKLNFAVQDSIVPRRALKADALSTARKITLTGDVTGEAEFDGSQNVNVVTSVQHGTPGFGEVGDVQITGGFGFTETYAPGTVHDGSAIGLFTGQWRCQGSFKVNATDSATLWLRIS